MCSFDECTFPATITPKTENQPLNIFYGTTIGVGERDGAFPRKFAARIVKFAWGPPIGGEDGLGRNGVLQETLWRCATPAPSSEAADLWTNL